LAPTRDPTQLTIRVVTASGQPIASGFMVEIGSYPE